MSLPRVEPKIVNGIDHDVLEKGVVDKFDISLAGLLTQVFMDTTRMNFPKARLVKHSEEQHPWFGIEFDYPHNLSKLPHVMVSPIDKVVRLYDSDYEKEAQYLTRIYSSLSGSYFLLNKRGEGIIAA